VKMRFGAGVLGSSSPTLQTMRALGIALLLALLASCAGPQSALDPRGEHAEILARIFWWMSGGAIVLWLLVLAITLRAAFRSASESSEPQRLQGAKRLIIYGGVVVPSVLLTVLLGYGLALLPRMLASAPTGSLQVQVEGRQWWWRIRYLPANGEPVELANEIRLPVGEPVEFLLESHDVIHSFWIPSLGGKVDMIPGRQTRLSLLPTKTGELRGVCAEFCGDSHAFMAFPVVIEEKIEFARWLDNQRALSRAPSTAREGDGLSVFLQSGCGACHSVRGTRADGVIGPDLTHVGARLSLGAGALPNQTLDFERWVSSTSRLKPGAHMPPFGMLPRTELSALAAFLESLK
jgi:cytochrome c oxidase subunit II